MSEVHFIRIITGGGRPSISHIRLRGGYAIAAGASGVTLATLLLLAVGLMFIGLSTVLLWILPLILGVIMGFMLFLQHIFLPIVLLALLFVMIPILINDAWFTAAILATITLAFCSYMLIVWL